MGGDRWTRNFSSLHRNTDRGRASSWSSSQDGSELSRPPSGISPTHGSSGYEHGPRQSGHGRSETAPSRSSTALSYVGRMQRGQALRSYLDPEQPQTWQDVMPILTRSAEEARERDSWKAAAIALILLAGVLFTGCILFWPGDRNTGLERRVALTAVAGPW